MENLVNNLKKELNGLRLEYIKQTKFWAVEEHARIIEKHKMFDKYENDFYKYQNGEISQEQSYFKSVILFKKAYNNYAKNYTIATKTTTEKYIDLMVKDAELKFENSILKLAQRIIKKDLNLNNLKFQTSFINVNLNTTITDGEKTVKASTILAFGEIQRPHYRYLVK